VAIKNKYPLVINYDANDNVSGLAEVQLATSDASDIGGDTPSDGQVLTYISADGVYQPRTPTGGGGGGAVDSVNEQTGDVSLYLSSLSAVSFTDLQAPQHLEWDGTNWVNAFEDVQYFRVYNNTASQLDKGSVVFVSGSHNANVAEVGLAQADSADTMPAIGIIRENILAGTEGLAVTFGRASGLALPSPTYTEGDTLYVSPTTPGEVTNQKPTDPSHLIQNIGIVTQTHASNGVAKITGVGRSNDIPNTITLGATTITSASAKFANVDANHILISTAASATSSIASATLFGDYVKSVEGQTPDGTGEVSLTTDNIPQGSTNSYITTGEQTKLGHISVTAAVDLNAIKPTDLAGTTTNNDIIIRNTDSTFGVIEVGNGAGTFLGNDFFGTPAEGSTLEYVTGESTGWSAVPALDLVDFGGGGQIDHGTNLSGLGDDDHTQYVLSAGTRSMSALTVNNEITTKDIEVTRLGQGRPTNFTWTSDYLASQVYQNGWLQGFGTGGSIGGDSTMLNQYQDVAGIISLGVNSNSSARASMYTNNDTLYASGQAWSFATRACMQSASVAGATYSGVIGVANSATDYNLPGYGVYFYCGHGGGNWIARTTGQFGNTETDTGVALSSYTLSVLQIMCNEDWSKAEFYIDGSSVATHTTNLPNRIDNTGFLYKIWNNGAATAGGKMYVDWHDIKVISTSVDRGEGHIKDFSDFTP